MAKMRKKEEEEKGRLIPPKFPNLSSSSSSSSFGLILPLPSPSPLFGTLAKSAERGQLRKGKGKRAIHHGGTGKKEMGHMPFLG